MKKLNILALPEKIMLALLIIIGTVCVAMSYASYVKNVEFSRTIKIISEQAHLQYDIQHSSKPYSDLNKRYCVRSDIDPNFICVISKQNTTKLITDEDQLDCSMLSILQSNKKTFKEKAFVL